MHTTSVSLWTGNDWMRHVLWHDATRQRDSVDIWSRDEVGCGQTPPQISLILYEWSIILSNELQLQRATQREDDWPVAI